MIQEISIAELDPRQVKQIEVAEKTGGTNPQYALDIYSAVLKQAPNCLELRKKLRTLQLRALGGGSSGLTKFIGKVTSTPFRIEGKAKVEKDPEAALAKAEDKIGKNVENIVAHQILAEAATALEMPKTAIFAYDVVRQLEPDNIQNLKDLGNAYLADDDTENAIRAGNLILRHNPGDGEAEDLLKRAHVAVAMHKGKWEESEDYREQLKDESEAQTLEQASRTVTDARGIEMLIQQTYDKIQAEPDDLNHYRQISDLYHRSNDLETAIAWIQKARELEAGTGDVALEEKEFELTLEYFERAIEDAEGTLVSNPENAELKAQRDASVAQRNAFRRQRVESMVERYPNDYAYRHEYGKILFDENDFDGAISQFQLAQRNPNVRLDAMLHLGRSYSHKGFHDLAVEQFLALKNEIPIMDDRKKDAVYELGICYEKMGKTAEAIEEFKAIYSADISYRDVAAKIDASYSSASEG